MPGSPQTVYDLRRQWKPHKERLATVRSEHPTAIRFHRACSWLSEVEQLDPVRHADQILLHQWIAFEVKRGRNFLSFLPTTKTDVRIPNQSASNDSPFAASLSWWRVPT